MVTIDLVSKPMYISIYNKQFLNHIPVRMCNTSNGWFSIYNIHFCPIITLVTVAPYIAVVVVCWRRGI